MTRSFLAACLLFIGSSEAVLAQAPTPPPAAPQQQQQPAPRQLYERGDTMVRSLQTNISFPTTAGPLTLRNAREFSHEGEGIDSGLSYQSADDQVIGTIYFYYPGFSHLGFTAYEVDRALAINSNTPLRRLGPAAAVAAGGRPNAALRADYANYMGRASSAAFLKIGRWIVKLRVTGPTARAAEVAAAMTQLLNGMTVPDGARLAPAIPVAVTECPGTGPTADVAVRPHRPAAENTVRALLATFDAGGMEARNERGSNEALPSRVAARWCVSSYRESNNRGPILRAADGAPQSPDGRSVILVPLSDSGDMVEVVHVPDDGGYVVFGHQMGVTQVYGAFAALPSDRQIMALFSGNDAEITRAVARVQHKPDGNENVMIQADEAPASH